MDQIAEVGKGSMSGLTNEDELMTRLNGLAKDKIKLIKDPIERYKIELPRNNYDFFDKIINDNKLPIEGVETHEELLDRIEYFIKYLRSLVGKKIMVITHSGFLEVMLKTLFNLSVLPQGNMSNGKNCSVCYCVCRDGVFTMVSPQNTEHLSIDLD